MPTCFDVADFFLASQDEEAGDTISNLKLQKLCYYAQGFTVAVTGEPLFPELFQAWAHGPVLPNLYHAFKGYGASAIPKPERTFPEVREVFSSEQLEILDEVKEVYGQFSAWKLRDMTHHEKPWMDAFSNDPFSTTVIPLESMAAFFRTKLA